MLDLEGQEVYSEEGRTRYLKQITQPEVTSQLQRLYRLLDQAVRAWKEAREQMLRLGERYPEIKVFQQVSGVGPWGRPDRIAPV